MSLDVVVPQDLARRRHVQRAVADGDAVRLIEAARDEHDTISLVIAIAVNDRVDLAGSHRAHEHGTSRTERHLARVLDAVSKDRDLEARGNHPLTGCLRVHTT